MNRITKMDHFNLSRLMDSQICNLSPSRVSSGILDGKRKVAPISIKISILSHALLSSQPNPRAAIYALGMSIVQFLRPKSDLPNSILSRFEISGPASTILDYIL